MSNTQAKVFPTKSQISEIFANLTRGADDVSWTVMGSHALSGKYNSKADFLSNSAGRIGAVIDGPMKLKVKSVIGGDVEEWAVIEMVAEARCKNGMLYDNSYSWSTRWEAGKIVEVRAYLDGLLLNRALEGNEEGKP